jgi:hypothetical protein
LYFNPLVSIKISEILQEGGYNADVLRSTWTTESQLGDVFMIASYKKMIEFITSLTMEKWLARKETDWHVWFSIFSKSIFTDVINIAFNDHIICRYFSKLGDDFITVSKHHHDWRDLNILCKSERLGRHFSISPWMEKIISKTKQRWAEGYYDKYKHYGKNNQ